VGNEGKQPPLPPEQGPLEQQAYYGWQYDQDETEVRPPSASPQPPRLFLSPKQRQPSENPAQAREALRSNVSPMQQQRYQQPIQDMGMTLGYGQGTENQYFEVPQPSQPMAQLRQERLQQLREERMRRQQRRMRGGDVTMNAPRNNSGRPGLSLPGVNQATPPPASYGRSTSSSGTSNPAIPTAPSNNEDIVPVRSSTLRPEGLQFAPRKEPTGGLQPSAASAQDTGMIQKVRIGRATAILTIAFVASRVLGIVRTSMFSSVFGTSHVSDAYLQAFLVPDFIFNIVAGGALSSAFIPVYTQYMVAEGNEKKAWHVASSALNLALALMSILALIVIIFAHQIVPLYNVGITNPQELNMIVSLTRVMLLQSIALGGGVIVTAVLNAKQDFRLPAIGTVLYNVGLIAGLVPGLFMALTGHGSANTSLDSGNNFAVSAATWGVVAGAVLQVAIQIPGLVKVGMKYTPSFDFRHPGVIQIGRQMLPRIFNSAMVYLSTYVDRTLILLVVGSIGGGVTQYYQAFQLVLLPYGIFGLSSATAAFPTLAENVSKGRFDRVRNTILETLRSILFMSIPSSVGLIVLGLPVIQVLLQHGAYSLTDAQATSIPLAFFALGLAALAAVEILVRSFYAMRDTKTPVIVSIAQFIFKIALSLVIINVATFGYVWGLAALAFSTSVANIIEASVLFWLLHQRIGDMQVKALLRFIGRVVFVSLVMGAALLVTRLILDVILNTTSSQSLGILGTIEAMVKLVLEVFVGVFIYVRLSRRMGIEELGPLKRILGRLKLSWI
jgi:putative peptidoglycan lipid II flippase